MSIDNTREIFRVKSFETPGNTGKIGKHDEIKITNFLGSKNVVFLKLFGNYYVLFTEKHE